ncbi:hypothetical protein O3P69_020227 [Scylla paramamosain]|uniref:Uncharacterized protein n=1 Tax=Scylla paramamosain TaxID=85552 RepID=A0AAW0TKD1_SCYPA
MKSAASESVRDSKSVERGLSEPQSPSQLAKEDWTTSALQQTQQGHSSQEGFSQKEASMPRPRDTRLVCSAVSVWTRCSVLRGGGHAAAATGFPAPRRLAAVLLASAGTSQHQKWTMYSAEERAAVECSVWGWQSYRGSHLCQ